MRRHLAELLLDKRDELQKAKATQSKYYVGDLFVEHTKVKREITNLEKAVTRAAATESLAREALPTSQLTRMARTL